MSRNLLTSDGGLQLVPEICLRIVECAKYNPETIRTIKGLSRSFNELVSRNEQSISRTIAAEQLIPEVSDPPLSNCPRCISCAAKAKAIRKKAEAQRAQSFKRQLQPSTISTSDKSIQIHTYSWLSELHFRDNATRELLDNDIMSLIPSSNFVSQFGFLNIALKVIEGRLERLKRNALDLMFSLVDISSSFKEPESIRRVQEEAIADLTPQELALLDMMTIMFSGGYAAQERKTRVGPGEEVSIREEQFVFEDRVLKYGPFFAWSYVFGNQQWVRERMDEGMQELRAFEEGKTSAMPGLPSFITRTFCEKVGCSFDDRWRRMNAAVDEMLSLST